MFQPIPQTLKFDQLVIDIKKGEIKIPQFQRNFVWSKAQAAKLMDSILKGYPIGTFILWKTRERLRAIRNIGNIALPAVPEGDFVQYVLDGQQRMTSLFASLEGVTVIREDGSKDDFSKMYVDLAASDDDDIVICDVEGRGERTYISVRDLYEGKLSVLTRFDEIYHSKLQDYKDRIKTYDFSSILIKDAPVDVATEVFTRINVGGKSLSLFEIMAAKTYDSIRDFDLSEKYDHLIEELEQVDYGTISDATVLQTISVILRGDCTRKTILSLERDQFISLWDGAIDAIKLAIDYFRSYYRIPVSHLLPYNTLLVPFAYYFYKTRVKPTGVQQKYLQDYFWRVSLTERFSSSVEAKISQDIKKIDEIINGALPVYDFNVNLSLDYITNSGWFSAGRSYIKALLSILAYHQPQSFNDSSLVIISNDWLKQANSKNYHHFFPRAYLKKKGEEEFYINHIFNITIVDDFLNKREIQAKAPSIYMKKFLRENPNLDTTMKTHLINDITQYGIWGDDYDTFFDMRGEMFRAELMKRIIKQPFDIF